MSTKNRNNSDGLVRASDRSARLRQNPLVVWFTGLSGAGKTTLAIRLEKELHDRGYLVYRLDGDALRAGLNSDLGFDPAARAENIRRAAEVASVLLDAGLVVLCSFISPFSKDRAQAAETVGRERFLEVYLDCPLQTCHARDVKGLYAEAGQGRVHQFTGISSPYEIPEQPALILSTGVESVEACTQRLLEIILPRITR